MRYKTKADWAAAQASELRSRAVETRFQSSAGSTSRARRKYQGIDTMHAEAARFERMAERFRQQGI